MHKEIAEQFEELGCSPSEDILDKCVELCYTYKITDAMEFVAQWMAYSVSNLDGADPTIPLLLEMERKEFILQREKELIAAQSKKKKTTSHLSDLGAFGSPSRHVSNVDDDDQIMDSYGCMTPKAKPSAIARTPAQRQNEVLFSPASYSQISGTPRAQGAAGSGKIVYTFGNPQLLASATWSSSSLDRSNRKVAVKQLLTHNGKALDSKAKYMFDILQERAENSGDRIFQVGKNICKKVFGPTVLDYDLQNVDDHSQETVKTIGTICCDSEGCLDATSTLLVGSDESMCRTVRLNFSETKSFGVFPGQVVMVSGRNPKGDTIIVEEVIADRVLQPPTIPKLTESLSFVVAAGPFTNSDDLVYDPLHDLVLYCKDNQPDVLILTGPLMDAEHKSINENVLAEPFEVFFEKMISGLVEVLGNEITILVVASCRDANSDPVYPTMPVTLKMTYPNVHMLPDPSIVDLNGITIGMTSTDVLDHILNNELAVNAGEKIKRAVCYLFNQGSFYPLNPPGDDRLCFDSSLANKYTNIENIPNLMILPGDQKCFLRVVNGCLAINPGRLADEKGGTFARFVLYPPSKEEDTSIFSVIACQVRKV
ncbi:DNA polymerase alpha subunit B [Eupeodes corollae]|uniref:DNA polymerase alpha subunit B n=1 Tax=Eupeodes corollae TaxID=290404 RepID=UPI00248FB91A|nr:DNA polymerase alpha subunit B [Eupeodes corollae]